MKKIFEETIVSVCGYPTDTEALKVLNEIRKAHPSSSGWEELGAYIEKRSDGYHAVRHHRKIA